MTRHALDPKQPGFADVDGQAGRAYNEAAFRYFLHVERKRAEHASRHLLLVMIRARKDLRTRPRMAPETARATLGALGACVREVDLVGWYRDGLVAAALLHTGDAASSSTRQTLRERITSILRHRLDSRSAYLQVRVIGLAGKPRR